MKNRFTHNRKETISSVVINRINLIRFARLYTSGSLRELSWSMTPFGVVSAAPTTLLVLSVFARRGGFPELCKGCCLLSGA